MPRLDVRALVARGQVVQFEDAEQVVADLDEHPLAEAGRLNDEAMMLSVPCSSVEPFDRSTYGRPQPNHATMRTWPSRGGIRCAICWRCTSRSGSWSAPMRQAGRRRSTCTKPPTEYVLTAELPGLTRDQIDIHAEDKRVVIRGERGRGRACRASSSIASSAATAASRARSRCPRPIDVDARHRRPQGRHADRHASEGRATAAHVASQSTSR